MVDDGRSGGHDLSGERERTAAGLGEDAVAGAVDDVRGEREHSGTVDVGDELGIGRRVAPDTSAVDRVRAISLEDQAAGGEGERVARADREVLTCVSRLKLDLVDRHVARQTSGLGDPRGYGVRDWRDRGRNEGVAIKGLAGGIRAVVLDEVKIAVAGRENDSGLRVVSRDRGIPCSELEHGGRGRGHEQRRSSRIGGHGAEGHRGDVRGSVAVDRQEVGAGAGGQRTEGRIELSDGAGFPH